MSKPIDEIQKELDKFLDSKYGSINDKKANIIESGLITKNNKLGFFANDNQKLGGQKSAKKQWENDREACLERSKMGGQKCKEEQKGIFTLSNEQLSNQGKKGYSNGLGKLSKQEKLQIIKKASLANREKNAKLKPDDVKYIREIFIPYHPEFGVVPLSKKYNVSEGTMRSAIKGKSFKDI